MFDRHRGGGSGEGLTANASAESAGRKYRRAELFEKLARTYLFRMSRGPNMPNAGGTQLDKDSIGQKETSFSSPDSSA